MENLLIRYTAENVSHNPAKIIECLYTKSAEHPTFDNSRQGRTHIFEILLVF